MDKKIKNFLTEKGFVKHPSEQDKLIYQFTSNSGIIVSCYESDEDEEKYEFTLNYLSCGAGNPELIFCALEAKDLISRFDLMYQLSYNLCDFLRNHSF